MRIFAPDLIPDDVTISQSNYGQLNLKCPI